jgi:hypothetical protein
VKRRKLVCSYKKKIRAFIMPPGGGKKEWKEKRLVIKTACRR